MEIQKLSDAYVDEEDDDVPLELICTVYNINPNNNDSLKHDSFVLRGYTIFVEKVKEYIVLEDEYAITHAIEYCIANDVLKDFFETRKDEVRKNMTIDMTFEAREKIIRRDEFEAGKAEGRAEGISVGRAEGISVGRAEGITVGRAEGKAEILLNLISRGFDVSQAVELTGLTKEQAEEILTRVK